MDGGKKIGNDMSNGLRISNAEAHDLTWELNDANANLAAVHRLAVDAVAHLGTEDGIEAVSASLEAIKALAKIGSLKVDYVARQLGEAGFGTFDEEFSKICRPIGTAD